MSRLGGLAARIRGIFHARQAEARMEEEFRFHVEMESARLIAAGVAAHDARRQALLAFGGLDRYRETMRDGRGARWFDDVLADVRYAWRAMRRSPAFTVATALTLGIGIGVNGITFGFVNSLLLRPLPARNPEQLVGVFSVNTRTGQSDLLSYDDYLDFRDRSGVFEGLAGRTDGPLNLVVPRGASEGAGGEGPADMVWGEFVTENYFTVLGVQPALGRLFTAADAPQGSNAFAVLSFDAWQGRFRGDSSVIGKVVRLNGTAFTITGVAPRGFRGIRTFGFWPEVWTPIGMHAVVMPGSANLLQGRGAGGWLMAVGRMREGWTRERTARGAGQFAAQLQREFPATDREQGILLLPGASGFDHPGFVKSSVLQLSSALGIFASIVVLLIICANLANLQLARSRARAREIAIRLSLGCSRARLTRQFLVEAILVALPGAVIAAAVIFTAPALESLMIPHLQFKVGFNPVVDSRVIGYTAAIAILAVLLFGLGPAWRASRPELVPSLSSVIGASRRTRHGPGNLLVVSQLALSVVLLVAGTLFVRSLLVARSVDLGFDPKDRLLVSTDISLQGYDEARGRRFYLNVADRLRALPGISSVSWAFPVPFDTYGRGTSLYVEGATGTGTNPTVTFNTSLVDVGFTNALGLRMLSGRSFTPADSNGTTTIMLISEQLATRLWPGKDAVGRVARVGGANGPEITVAGIVHDARFAMIGETSQQRVYLPLRQNYRGWMTLVVHSQRGAASVARDVRTTIAALDATLPTFGVMTMEASVASGFSTQQTAAGVGGFFGVVALLVAAIGLYAVVAGSVAERTREIGVRMALGATPGGVMRLMMRGGARLGAIGLAIGLAGSVVVASLMRGLLFGIAAHDPLTFLLVPVALGLVVFFATWLPARRAVQLDPVSALRSE